MTRLRGTIAPLLVAAALTGAAFATARSAGCEEPARYELRGGGYELVGGCIAPGDLVVPRPVPPAAPVDAAGTPAKG